MPNKSTLPPKKLSVSVLQTMSISLLVGHLASHERYARLQLQTKQEYVDYYNSYLDRIYELGDLKDAREFAYAIALARVNSIPFIYEQNKPLHL